MARHGEGDIPLLSMGLGNRRRGTIPVPPPKRRCSATSLQAGCRDGSGRVTYECTCSFDSYKQPEFFIYTRFLPTQAHEEGTAAADRLQCMPLSGTLHTVSGRTRVSHCTRPGTRECHHTGHCLIRHPQTGQTIRPVPAVVRKNIAVSFQDGHLLQGTASG